MKKAKRSRQTPRKLRVRYLPYDDLKHKAEYLLDQMQLSGAVPVPIEEIVDNHFRIDIIPVPGLIEHFETDAWISIGRNEIYMDDSVYRNSNSNRYRFSLAHELGHKLLHDDIIQRLNISSVASWKKAIREIPDDDYSRLEFQAYEIAVLILEPHLPSAMQHAMPLKESWRGGSGFHGK